MFDERDRPEAEQPGISGQPDEAGQTNWWPLIVAFASIMLSAGTLLLFFGAWTADQIALAEGNEWGRLAWPLIGLAYAGWVATVGGLGVRFARQLRYRAVFRAWLLAGLFALFCAPIHLAAATDSLLAAALQALSALAFVVLLSHLNKNATAQAGPYWPAAAALVAWPWFMLGSLGSVADTLVNLVAALLFGLAFYRLMTTLLPALEETCDDAFWNVALGGVAAGTALAVMGAAFGIGGQRLILMNVLPATSWAVMGIVAWGRGRALSSGARAAGLFVGLVAAAPLLLVDPDELMLILNLGSRDVGFYAIRAALLSILIGWALGGLALAVARRLVAAGGMTLGRVAAAVGVPALLLVLLVEPQRGWHGERLFVIMDEQADLSAAADIADPTERRAAVYEALVARAEETQGDLRAGLDRFSIDYTPYYLVNGLEVDGGPLVRFWLSRQPGVDRVLDSPQLRPLPEPVGPTTGTAGKPDSPQWNLGMVYAPAVWQEFDVRGEGVVIGQADSGADGVHPEFAQQYRGATDGALPGDDFNWYDPWNNSPSPVDIGGHGTHTLGSILGQSVGVAPGATWIGCVNLARNLGNPAHYLDCMQFLFAPFPQGGDALRDGRPDLGAHVFNNSWGCPEIEGCDAEALRPAVRALREAGVFVVVSAGNEGPTCSSVDAPLALYDEVLSVGSVDRSRVVSDFSSRGPVTADGSGRAKPDIAAPGSDVLSAFPGGTYEYSSGTSMAGPHVAGVVALLWSAEPSLIGDIERTEQFLIGSAQPAEVQPPERLDRPASLCGPDDALPNNDTGYGIVDARAAILLARQQAR